MDYFKAFETLKTSIEKTKFNLTDGHFAIQVCLTDEDCGGIFYIEAADKQLYVEPYDYYDNDAAITVSFKDLKNIVDGKISAKKAAEDGKLIIAGNADLFLSFTEAFLKNKAKKRTTSKTSTKAAEKKVNKTETKTTTSKKKTEAKKPAKKPVKKETAKTEILPEKSISAVVEAEINPKKKTKKSK